MTSESDSKAGRRPPTIELKATEVGNAAESPPSGGAESASERAASHEPLGESTAGSNAGDRQSSGHSGGRVTSHVLSALLGAAAAAAIIGGVWLGGLIPPRNAATPSDMTPPLSAGAPMPGAATPTGALDADVAARLDKIERTIQAERAEPALGDRMTAVETQTKSLGSSVATLSGRVDEIASASQSAEKQAEAAHAAAEAATSATQAISQATGQAVSQNTAQRSDVEALANRIAVLEGTVKALAAAATQPASQTDDRPARLSVAAEALRATVERGAPYQAELAAVQALGVDRAATAPLEPFAKNGVPSASALARELGAIVPALQEAAEPAAADGTFLDRLKANAQKLVRITPVDAPAGNDPADIIARIKFDAAHGDIAAALADLNRLPEPAKTIAADWIKKAEARGSAIAASRQIAADALAALSKPSAQ
jgi:hypothetical protein